MAKADFTPTLEGYTEQKKLRFWCQKVLPLVYDESLSYYEVLNKMVVYLNQVIDNNNTVIDNVETMENDFNDLKDYVDNFFDDIDQLVTYAERAEAAETAALSSSANAAQSASNSATSASNAASSASTASTMALSAMDARDAAQTAQTAAETARSNAQSAAISANSQAANAASSATAAQQSSESAETAKTAAQTAATNANTSAASAAQSATDAAESVDKVSSVVMIVPDLFTTDGKIENSGYRTITVKNNQIVITTTGTNGNYVNALLTKRSAFWSGTGLTDVTAADCFAIPDTSSMRLLLRTSASAYPTSKDRIFVVYFNSNGEQLSSVNVTVPGCAFLNPPENATQFAVVLRTYRADIDRKVLVSIEPYPLA